MFPNHCAHIIHLVIIKPENKTQDFVFQKKNFFSLSLLACLFPSATQKNARHCLSQTKMAPHPLDSGKINWLSSLLKTTYASSIANVKPQTHSSSLRNVIKNWPPLVSGPRLAILNTPGPLCFRVKFSSSNLASSPLQMENPPVPKCLPAKSPACKTRHQ